MPFTSRKRLAAIEDAVRSLREEIRSLRAQAASGGDAEGTRREDARIEIRIDRLDVQEVKLEQLSFALDQIAIEDLSGSFNLGNNFLSEALASRPAEKAPAPPSGAERATVSAHPPGDDAPAVSPSRTGYRIRIP